MADQKKEYTAEEVEADLQVVVNCLHRLPESDEKRTALPRVERLLAEVRAHKPKAPVTPAVEKEDEKNG
jgi:hypothetical protein